MALQNGLLQAAKTYLDITWTDTETDTKLTGILERGCVYLDRIAGKPQDYSVEGEARALLFDYTRYVRAGAADEFEKNYMSALLALQITAAGEIEEATTP